VIRVGQLQQLGIGRFNPNENSGDPGLRMNVVRKIPVSPEKDMIVPGGRPGHAKPGTIGELLPPDPSWDPSPDAPTTTSWPGKITANSGSGPWSYTVVEQEQSSSGYSNWTAKSGGKSVTAYNFAEDANTQLKDHVQNDTIVHVREIGDEYWFQAYNIKVGHVFPITLSQTGGDAGTESAATSWTYTVTDAITGAELGTGVNPTTGNHKFVRQSLGQMSKATYGFASYDASGNLVIGWINEAEIKEAC